MATKIGDVTISVDGPYVVISGNIEYCIMGRCIEEVWAGSDQVRIYRAPLKDPTYTVGQVSPENLVPTLNAIRRAAIEAGQWRRG